MQLTSRTARRFPERASGEPNRHGFVRCSDMFGSSSSADFHAGKIKRPEQEIGWEGTAGFLSSTTMRIGQET